MRIFFLFAVCFAPAIALGDPVEDPARRWHPAGAGGTPSFAKHIVPLLSKQGCAARECHGSFQGQGGFRLSLFGYDLKNDFAELTHDETDDGPRRRVDIGDPEQSLALRKPLAELDHDGGQRLERGTWQFRVLRDWIAAGAKFDAEAEPYLEKLELQPAEVRFAAGSGPVALRLFAHFSDGQTLDATALAQFSSRDAAVADVGETGIVQQQAEGDTTIVASYGSQVTTAQVLVPNANGQSHFPEFPPQNRIDKLVRAKLYKLGIHPSQRSTDAEFMRRAYVDVIGTLPTPSEARRFLADTRPDKRTRLIDRLLQREEYALYWATIWSDWTGNGKGVLNPNYKVMWLWHGWFANKLGRNVPFDELARGLVVASSREGRSLADYLTENEHIWSRINTYERKKRNEGTHLFDDGTYAQRETLDLFWMKRDGDPEELAIRTASTLLGIQINCAQCHKHPFDRWTQADFESFTSFFRTMDVRALDGGERPGRRDFGKVALYPGYYRGQGGPVQKHPPKILGGPVVGYDPAARQDSREDLWDWMVAPDNPYFARSIVNRIWGHYFGVGIVDPIDDFNAANPPSNPALLDWLAKDFIQHRFDLKHLHRRILNSRTYQLSHLPNDFNRSDRRNFSHARIKRMPAEVLYDALLHVSGAEQTYSRTFVPSGTRTIAMGSTRLGQSGPEYALRTFGRPKREQSCACERSNDASLTQALYLLNDSDVLHKINDPRGNAARLARQFPQQTDNQALAKEVYLLTLNRYPRPQEIGHVIDYLASPDGSTRAQVVQDLLWSLVNVREFVFVK